MLREFRLWKLRRQARRVQKIATRLDIAMQKMGLPRQKRRQMWREIIKNPDVRKEAFGSLMGERS